MYGKKTLITDFIVEFITDFYLVKVSNKVHNKVCNESQLPIYDSSISSLFLVELTIYRWRLSS